MAKPNYKGDTQESSQTLQNRSYDADFEVAVTEGVEFDGSNLRRKQSDLTAVRIQTSGTDTFVAYAPIGTDTASALWQALKIDTNGNVLWADGDASFNNSATDLASLSYS